MQANSPDLDQREDQRHLKVLEAIAEVVKGINYGNLGDFQPWVKPLVGAVENSMIEQGFPLPGQK